MFGYYTLRTAKSRGADQPVHAQAGLGFCCSREIYQAQFACKLYKPEWLNISLILLVVGHLVEFPLTVKFSYEWSSEGCYKHAGDNC